VRRRTWGGVGLGLLVACAAGCGSVPVSPFPVVGPLDDAATVAVLRSRTAAVHSAYALLSMAFDSPDRSGTVDAAVNWRAPHELRVTAFKDLVLTTRDVFDLLLGAQEYALEFSEDDDGAGRDQGPLADFPQAQPEFAGFYWAGEALLLGGAVHDVGCVVRRDGETVEVAATLRNGAPVTWVLASDTLTPRSGRIQAPGGRVLTLRYLGWTQVGGHFLPHSVELDDPSAEFSVRFEAVELEVNVELDPTVFEPASVGSP